MDDYSKHPQSISEIKASKTERCKDWTPKDALISVLRDIDNGEYDIEDLVIGYRLKNKRIGYAVAGPTPLMGSALFHICSVLYMDKVRTEID